MILGFFLLSFSALGLPFLTEIEVQVSVFIALRYSNEVASLGILSGRWEMLWTVEK